MRGKQLLQTHGLGIAGEDAGDHRSDEFVEGFGAEAAAGKGGEGFVDAVAAGRDEEFGGEAHFSRPADQLRFEEARPVLREAVQLSGRIDEAFAGVVVGAQQPLADAEAGTEFEGHRLAVEKAVRPPFAEKAFFAQAPDFAAGPLFFFEDRDLGGNAGFFGQAFNRMGGGESGNSSANDGNLSHRLVSMVFLINSEENYRSAGKM